MKRARDRRHSAAQTQFIICEENINKNKVTTVKAENLVLFHKI